MMQDLLLLPVKDTSGNMSGETALHGGVGGDGRCRGAKCPHNLRGRTSNSWVNKANEEARIKSRNVNIRPVRNKSLPNFHTFLNNTSNMYHGK